jgi:glutathionylspermidine synthase
MERVQVSPRVDWEKKVVSNGLVYYKDETGRPYWNEGAYYHFTEKEILLVESATERLQEMCLAAAQHIIDNNLFHKLGIPDSIADLIRWCWNEEPPAIYGRFDLAFDGVNPPK